MASGGHSLLLNFTPHGDCKNAVDEHGTHRELLLIFSVGELKLDLLLSQNSF